MKFNCRRCDNLWPHRLVKVRVVLVCDGDEVCSDEHLDGDSPRWDALRASLSELRAGRPGGRGEVELSVDAVQFADCPQCTAAYTHALRGHTARVRDRGGSGGGGGGGLAQAAAASEYLDAAEMHAWLAHYNERFWQLDEGAAEDEVVLPVFWYRLQASAGVGPSAYKSSHTCDH